MATLKERRPAPPKVEVDPVTLDIIENALRNIRAEMDETLFRTAMSPGIREQHDEFPLIADRQGRMVVGQFGSFIHAFLSAFDGDVEEGDVFFTSDPYASNGAISHANDWLVLLPIFEDGLLIGWSSMFGHMTDVGGKVPGSLPTDATSIHEEGIVVPPFKLFRGGVLAADSLEIILNQVRIPEWNRADLNGVVAACRMAERRILELCQRFTTAVYLSAVEELLDRNYRAMQRLITTHLPDGVPLSFADYVDDDGRGFGPYRIACTLTRTGDRVLLDWSDTDPQSAGSINYLLNENILKMYFGIYMIMVFEPDILWNDGFYPLVDVHFPEGSLLSPKPPAALSCRTHALGRVFDVLGGLLGQQEPHFQNGAGFSSSPHLMYSGHTDQGEWYQLYQIGFGGVPGRAAGDGPDGHSMWPSFTNVPNEFLERYYPLRIERYVTVADSGGPGLNRGGNGVEVAYRFLQAGEISIHDDRWFTYPWGANGGQPGQRSTKILERADGISTVIPSKCDNVHVEPGDLLRYITWGGGGWGDALERDPERVLLDVERGLATVEGALRFGVVIRDGAIDPSATKRLRDTMRSEREPLGQFDFGPDIETLRRNSLAETGLPGPIPVGTVGRRDGGMVSSASSPRAVNGSTPDLAGKVVVVTGAASGIGRSTAVEAARAGARIVIGTFEGDPHDAGETLRQVVAAGGEGIVVSADVRSSAEVDAMMDAALERFGRIDVVVANAAVMGSEPIEELDDRAWDRVMDVDLHGVMRTCRAAAQRMEDGGSIIAIASIAGGVYGWAEHAHYAAAKSATIGLVRSLALELGHRGIRVNTVLPGLIETPQTLDATTSLGAEGLASAAHRVPLQRIGDPDQIAAVVTFLASDGADYVTGQSIIVDGGLSALLAV